MKSILENKQIELQSKIDNISNDLNNKEKELTTLVSKKEQLEKIIADKDEMISQMKDDTIKEKDEFNTKRDQ